MFRGGKPIKPIDHISEHFTGRSQWIKTCTVQTMWKQARTTYRISDVSAEETSQEIYRQKRTLYEDGPGGDYFVPGFTVIK